GYERHRLGARGAGPRARGRRRRRRIAISKTITTRRAPRPVTNETSAVACAQALRITASLLWSAINVCSRRCPFQRMRLALALRRCSAGAGGRRPRVVVRAFDLVRGFAQLFTRRRLAFTAIDRHVRITRVARHRPLRWAELEWDNLQILVDALDV